jgi:hypothetical protein
MKSGLWQPESMMCNNSPCNSYLSAVGPTLQPSASTPTSAQIFYAKNIQNLHNQSDTVTVAFSGTGTISAAGVVIVEYSGLDPNYPLDSVSAGYSYSASNLLDSGNVAPANSNLLLFGAGTSDAGTAQAAGLPWTVVQHNGGSVTEQNIVSGNNTLQRAPATLTGSAGNWLMQMVIFRDARK